MAINRIKYVNVDSKMEESDFVKHSSGGCVLQSLNVTENGTYLPPEGVDGFNEVNVNVAAPKYYIEKTVDSNGKLIVTNRIIDLSDVTDLGDYSLERAYYYNSEITGVALRNATSLTTVSGIDAVNAAFEHTNITSTGADSITTLSGAYAFGNAFTETLVSSTGFSNLITVSGSHGLAFTFSACSELVSVGLEKLTTISESAQYALTFTFSGCENIIEAEFPALETVYGNLAFNGTFQNCKRLKTVRYTKLDKICPKPFGTVSGRTFGGCLQLENIYFNAVKTSTFQDHLEAFRYLFNTDTGTETVGGCTIHFPSNFDPESPDKTFDITTMTSYPTFGGSADYIHLAYDLPATE